MQLLMLLGLIAGLFMIIKGGDLFVNSSVAIARIAHIKELLIGATIVSIGTTLPEFLTSLIATIKGIGGDIGYTDIAIGNAVGSMLANSGLILAIVLMIRPPKYESNFTQSSIYVLLITVLVCIFAYTSSRISPIEGIVLLILFVLFMTSNILRALKREDTLEEMPKIEVGVSRGRIAISFIIGALGIGIGALLLVDSAKALAVSLGVSEALLGVTLVAVGTSLPELVTSMTALRKGVQDIGVGNILGAHVINATLILGLIAVVSGKGIAVDPITRNISIWVLLAVMSVLIIPTLIRRRFSRVQGGIMLLSYLSFVIADVILTI